MPDVQPWRLGSAEPRDRWRPRKLYQHIAELVAKRWNKHGQAALVVGATCPAELADVRGIVGDLPFLVPGIGVQGGDVQSTVKNGKTTSGAGLVINSSRAILYDDQGVDFAAAARAAAISTRDEINRYR